ncbi:uncharacterized protein BDZ99DRAFT_482786 [Mytilinidion resinicola]|uniref:Uncharacterized protein n=1 Tax=Mytilinidion resinicola TaxID=574789 RepID=A0A6A6Y1H0_9PEZI|nr:uncharacterized protein BDZ99DRAFT_482786 [Mytilinidion resinicola]KAF2802661.1 hypothetical protein BDZ99DRAFT_482786 [Mytilinidion resinicola]
MPCFTSLAKLAISLGFDSLEIQRLSNGDAELIDIRERIRARRPATLFAVDEEVLEQEALTQRERLNVFRPKEHFTQSTMPKLGTDDRGIAPAKRIGQLYQLLEETERKFLYLPNFYAGSHKLLQGLTPFAIKRMVFLITFRVESIPNPGYWENVDLELDSPSQYSPHSVLMAETSLRVSLKTPHSVSGGHEASQRPNTQYYNHKTLYEINNECGRDQLIFFNYSTKTYSIVSNTRESIERFRNELQAHYGSITFGRLKDGQCKAIRLESLQTPRIHKASDLPQIVFYCADSSPESRKMCCGG